MASFLMRMRPSMLAARTTSVVHVQALAPFATGTCKWFDTKKGFGFIVPDDSSQDVFVHQSNIHADGFRSLAEGEALTYDVDTNDQGKAFAVNVTGPDGAFVEGAPRRTRDDYDEQY